MKALEIGTRVKVKWVRDNAADEVKALIGRDGCISTDGDPVDGMPTYYVCFENHPFSKKFYHDELEVKS